MIRARGPAVAAKEEVAPERAVEQPEAQRDRPSLRVDAAAAARVALRDLRDAVVVGQADPAVPQVRPEPGDRVVAARAEPLEQVAQRDRLEQRAPEVVMEVAERRVLRDRLVLRALEDLREQAAPMEEVDPLARVRPGRRATVDRRQPMVRQELRDPRARVEMTAGMEPVVRRAVQARLARAGRAAETTRAPTFRRTAARTCRWTRGSTSRSTRGSTRPPSPRS